jgi:hypothetical protein
VVGTWAFDISEDGSPYRESFRDQPTSHEALVAQLETGPHLIHPSVMMRRELVLAAGGYRAAYRHCEDYDLWLRLSERTRLCSIPERLLRYRHSESQVSSRHVLAQATGVAVAWAAHAERLAGRPDPTEGLDALPPIDRLDELFGRAGVSQAVRDKVARGIIYSKSALTGTGFDVLIDHLRSGGAAEGMWRTVARLVAFGEPGRASRLAGALVARR